MESIHGFIKQLESPRLLSISTIHNFFVIAGSDGIYGYKFKPSFEQLFFDDSIKNAHEIEILDRDTDPFLIISNPEQILIFKIHDWKLTEPKSINVQNAAELCSGCYINQSAISCIFLCQNSIFSFSYDNNNFSKLMTNVDHLAVSSPYEIYFSKGSELYKLFLNTGKQEKVHDFEGTITSLSPMLSGVLVVVGTRVFQIIDKKIYEGKNYSFVSSSSSSDYIFGIIDGKVQVVNPKEQLTMVALQSQPVNFCFPVGSNGILAIKDDQLFYEIAHPYVIQDSNEEHVVILEKEFLKVDDNSFRIYEQKQANSVLISNMNRIFLLWFSGRIEPFLEPDVGVNVPPFNSFIKNGNDTITLMNDKDQLGAFQLFDLKFISAENKSEFTEAITRLPSYPDDSVVVTDQAKSELPVSTTKSEVPSPPVSSVQAKSELPVSTTKSEVPVLSKSGQPFIHQFKCVGEVQCLTPFMHFVAFATKGNVCVFDLDRDTMTAKFDLPSVTSICVEKGSIIHVVSSQNSTHYSIDLQSKKIQECHQKAKKVMIFQGSPSVDSTGIISSDCNDECKVFLKKSMLCINGYSFNCDIEGEVFINDLNQIFILQRDGIIPYLNEKITLPAYTVFAKFENDIVFANGEKVLGIFSMEKMTNVNVSPFGIIPGQPITALSLDSQNLFVAQKDTISVFSLNNTAVDHREISHPTVGQTVESPVSHETVEIHESKPLEITKDDHVIVQSKPIEVSDRRETVEIHESKPLEITKDDHVIVQSKPIEVSDHKATSIIPDRRETVEIHEIAELSESESEEVDDHHDTAEREPVETHKPLVIVRRQEAAPEEEVEQRNGEEEEVFNDYPPKGPLTNSLYLHLYADYDTDNQTVTVFDKERNKVLDLPYGDVGLFLDAKSALALYASETNRVRVFYVPSGKELEQGDFPLDVEGVFHNFFQTEDGIQVFSGDATIRNYVVPPLEIEEEEEETKEEEDEAVEYEEEEEEEGTFKEQKISLMDIIMKRTSRPNQPSNSLLELAKNRHQQYREQIQESQKQPLIVHRSLFMHK